MRPLACFLSACFRWPRLHTRLNHRKNAKLGVPNPERAGNIEMNCDSEVRTGRRFSLRTYLAVVFAVSWPFQVIAPFFIGNRAAVFLLNGVSMLMVAVGTFIAARYVFRDGFAVVRWRAGRSRDYVAAISLVLLFWVAPTMIAFLLGRIAPPGHLSSSQILWLFLSFGVGLPLAFGEEFGWRGYLLPRLAQQLSPRNSVLIHGMIWWAWHLPFVIGLAAHAGFNSAEQTGLPAGVSVAAAILAVIVGSFVPVVLHAVVFAFLWTRSGSLAVVVVYHGAFNGVRDSLATLKLLDPITGLCANAIIVATGAAMLWRADWSMLTAGSLPKPRWRAIESSEVVMSDYAGPEQP